MVIILSLTGDCSLKPFEIATRITSKRLSPHRSTLSLKVAWAPLLVMYCIVPRWTPLLNNVSIFNAGYTQHFVKETILTVLAPPAQSSYLTLLPKVSTQIPLFSKWIAPFHRYVPKSTPDSHQAEAMSRVSYCLQTYNSCELLCRSHQDASRTSCFNRDLNLAQTFFQTENPALYTCEYPLKLWQQPSSGIFFHGLRRSTVAQHLWIPWEEREACRDLPTTASTTGTFSVGLDPVHMHRHSPVQENSGAGLSLLLLSVAPWGNDASSNWGPNIRLHVDSSCKNCGAKVESFLRSFSPSTSRGQAQNMEPNIDCLSCPPAGWLTHLIADP